MQDENPRILDARGRRAAEIEKALGAFYGTEHWFRHSTGHLFYTDGIAELAKLAGAYWLIDAIASWQPELPERERRLQLWTLTVAEASGVLICRGFEKNVFARQKIAYTDFPLDEIEVYVEDGVLLLPSEY